MLFVLQIALGIVLAVIILASLPTLVFILTETRFLRIAAAVFAMLILLLAFLGLCLAVIAPKVWQDPWFGVVLFGLGAFWWGASIVARKTFFTTDEIVSYFFGSVLVGGNIAFLIFDLIHDSAKLKWSGFLFCAGLILALCAFGFYALRRLLRRVEERRRQASTAHESLTETQS